MIRLKRGRRSYAATPRRFVAVVAVVQHLGVGVVDDDGHVGDLRRASAGLFVDREIGRRVRHEGHLVRLERVHGHREYWNRNGHRTKVVAVALHVAVVAVSVAVSRILDVETLKKI